MAISQIGKGVFIVKPDKFKRYQDTAAGKYTSIFTKARMDQWELALKEAERKSGVKEFEYKAKLELYRDRLRQQERELADLQKLRIQVLNGEVKAEDAAIALGVKVEQSNVREQNKRDVQVAAVGAATEGTTTSTGGGKGRQPPRADEIDATTEEAIGKAKDEASPGGTDPSATVPASPAAFAGAVRTRLDDGRIVAGTPEKTDAVKYNAVSEMVEAETARVMASDPNKTYDDARSDAQSIVEGELGQANRDFFDAYSRVEAKVDAADVTAGTPSKSVTTRKVQFYKKYKNLDTEARRALEGGVESIPAIPIAAREAVLDEITAAEKKIRERAIEAPTLGETDVITEARRIAAGRFGPLSPVPAAFEERNALQRLLNMSDEEFAKARAEVAKTLPSGAPIAPPPAAENVPEAERRGTEVISAPTAPRTAGGSGMGEAFPYEAEITAAESRIPAATAPAEPPEPAEPRIAPEPQIRPEAAMLMTEAERQDFLRRLEDRAALGELMRQQKAEIVDIAGPSDAYREASTRPMSPPAALPRPQRPVMEAPRSVAEAMVMPSIPVPPPPSIGSYTPGPVPPAAPRPSGPSTEGAAPKGPAAAPEGFLERPSRPGAAQMRADIAIKEASKPKLTEVLQQDTRPTVGRYFTSRAEVADKLADQPDKIKRLTASGPGRVASDIYKANKANGIEFKTTWQEIQMTFADDRASMERAHEIALALDMMDEDAKQAKE